MESLFIAYRLTGDQKYRDWGWQIFQSIEKHCKLEGGGYTSIRNVDRIEGEEGRLNVMETFFLVSHMRMPVLWLRVDHATHVGGDVEVLVSHVLRCNGDTTDRYELLARPRRFSETDHLFDDRLCIQY